MGRKKHVPRRVRIAQQRHKQYDALAAIAARPKQPAVIRRRAGDETRAVPEADALYRQVCARCFFEGCCAEHQA